MLEDQIFLMVFGMVKNSLAYRRANCGSDGWCDEEKNHS